MESIFNYNENQLREISKKASFYSFKGSQLYRWIYINKILDINLMHNLDLNYKKFILGNFKLLSMKIIRIQKNKDKSTIKLLLEIYPNKENIEIVIMRYINEKNKQERNTLCISSQIGCTVKCPFCETGRSGLIRNLSFHEILEQFIIANNYLNNYLQGKRGITNIVYMGMGEPLLNWENVLISIRKINVNFGISERKITISTSGIVPIIDKISDLKHQWVLAISLHASNDNLRNELVPINKKYNLEMLIRSCLNYVRKTKKRITFEYVMINNKNIFKKNVIELKKILKNIKCNINAINLNETKSYKYKEARKNEVKYFYYEMKKEGFNIFIRGKKGNDINAACGQLKILKGVKDEKLGS